MLGDTQPTDTAVLVPGGTPSHHYKRSQQGNLTHVRGLGMSKVSDLREREIEDEGESNLRYFISIVL